MKRLFFPLVSQIELISYARIACSLNNCKTLEIFCDSESEFEKAFELSPAIAREFPLVRELIFYVADKKWIIVPTDQIR